MGSIPMLSEMRSFDGSDLTGGAGWLDAHADRLESVHAGVHSQATGLPWEGVDREATVARTGADLATAQHHAELLHLAAQNAREEAGNLTALAGNIVHAADTAGEAGFTVTDLYIVYDAQQSSDPVVAAARKIDAAQHQADLMSQLARFVVHDTNVGSNLATQGASVRAVDFGTGKGHIDSDGRCDDPDYQNGIERRLGASVIGGILVGGLMGGPVGAVSGGAGAGIADIIHELTGDGPCQ